MPKGWRRTWVRIFVTGWLHGSIRWQLEPEERGVWADLIALAGECGQDGAICDNNGQPFPRSFLANQLNISPELLDRTIAKCKHDQRIENNDEVIIITNWHTYQSEYQRQKPYRTDTKLAKQSTKEDEDPDKYIKGKYGKMVRR